MCLSINNNSFWEREMYSGIKKIMFLMEIRTEKMEKAYSFMVDESAVDGFKSLNKINKNKSFFELCKELNLFTDEFLVYEKNCTNHTVKNSSNEIEVVRYNSQATSTSTTSKMTTEIIDFFRNKFGEQAVSDLVSLNKASSITYPLDEIYDTTKNILNRRLENKNKSALATETTPV